MGKIKLLDCTIRDGGYLNDWEFGHDNLVSIFERLVDAKVDIIEVGFLDERREFDINRSIMPDTDCVEKIYGGLDRKQAMVVGMIDYGTCGLDHIKPCKDSFLDGIRVIFKKHLREPAMAFCKELKELGYKVFAQLVSVTSYSDEEMLDLIRIANDVKPYAVSMVDTYGLMHQDNLYHYFELLDQHLSEDIALGYHAHNNFQMGYANCIEMLSHDTKRMRLVDGTIYGMGKSAGNAPIELIMMHMNHKYGTQYQISQILEAIDVNIMQLHQKYEWGYNMFFYVAASNDCHPNYVSYLMDKKTLSVKSINEILSRLEGEKKLLYDKEYIEQLYKEYQAKNVDDKEDLECLKHAMYGRRILLVGPGLSIIKEKDKIKKYIEEEHPIVISVNFIDDNLDADFLFLTNSKRYLQLATKLSKSLTVKIIATSNVTKTSGRFDYTLNFSSLMDADSEVIDNPFIMFFNLLDRLEIGEVTLAGFDGYAGNENYIDSHMEYHFDEKHAEELNSRVRTFLRSKKQNIQAQFLTKSLYVEE